MTKTTIRIYLIFFLLFAIVCDGGSNTNSSTTRDYRQDMRDFVQAISAYGEENIPNFIIIPQNGQEIVTQNGEEDGVPATEYLNAINGVGREDLFYHPIGWKTKTQTGKETIKYATGTKIGNPSSTETIIHILRRLLMLDLMACISI